MKKEYKKLRKKLKNEFKVTTRDYSLNGSIGQWLKQCGIKKINKKHIQIICLIFESVPYCYQEEDRQFILKYLSENKYKVFRIEKRI